MTRITIRKLEENDAKTSYLWRNDKDVWKYTLNKPKQNTRLEDELEWIKKVLSYKNDYRFAIIADDNYVGNIYLTDATEKSAQYHIFIGDKTFWGKGVAYDASILLLQFAKNELKLKEVAIEVDQEHTSAIKLYKKLGFEINSNRAKISLMTKIL